MKRGSVRRWRVSAALVLFQLVREPHEAGAISMAELPEAVSDRTRRGVTANPAASISQIWFSVVWPTVETRT